MQTISISVNLQKPVLLPCSQSCTKTSWRPTYPTDRKHYVTSVGTQGGENAIKNQLAASGPVTACFDVYEDFKVHKGVYFRVYGKKVGKHAVVILGYGTATCGREKVTYWIIRNSWGTNWGEGGYFKFRRGRNDCGIEGDIAYGVPKL